MITFDFKDRVALITGSGRGIGFATARMFLEAGVRVMLNDVSQARLDSALERLGSYGERVAVFRADVGSRAEVESMFGALIGRWGRIDILVNNAADRPEARLVDMTEEQWDRNVDSILKGAFNCSQLAAKRMIAQGGGGKMVNVSSGSYKTARVGASAYCASKAGLVMFTAVLAQELGPYKINVNSVAPGLIDVGMDRTPAKAVYDNATVEATPWGRAGTPEDVAYVILMLCSEEAEYTTGAVVSVDGGLSLGRYPIPGSV